MSKILKIIGNILAISLDWTLLFIVFLAFVIRTSAVQTFLAQKAASFLSKELNTTIEIDKVAIQFFDRAALDGVLVLDQKKDTLAYIPTLFATLDELNLTAGFVRMRQAELEEGVIHLNRDSRTGDYNYEFLADYFSSGKKKKKSEPFAIHLESLQLTSVDFKYDDNRKGYIEFGMDYDHIDLKDVHLKATGFSAKNGDLAFHVNHLQAREKSGFILNKLSMNTRIESDGLKIKNLRIRTPKSRILIPKFEMLLDEMEDFEYFEDSVRFDAILSKSIVSLKDISYFASAMEGMDDQVTISAKITEEVKKLHIRDLDLRTGNSTILRGDLILPDFRDLDKAVFKEKLDYAYISLKDLTSFHLPLSAEANHIYINPKLMQFEHVIASDLRMNGTLSSFVLRADSLHTSKGTVSLKGGIHFFETGQSYKFQQADSLSARIVVRNIALGSLLNNSDLGWVDGSFTLSGEAFYNGKLDLKDLSGDVNRFDYLGYSYKNIKILKGQFVNNIFDAKIDIKDDNLDVTFDGKIDFNGKQHMQFSIDLSKALLSNLNLTKKPDSKLKSNFSVDIIGAIPNSMEGTIRLEGLLYQEGNKEIEVPSLILTVKRGKEEDIFTIKSKVANGTIKGKVDFETIISDFTDQFSKVFPSIGSSSELSSKDKKKKRTSKIKSHFSYEIETEDMDELLSIFAPDLKINPKSKLNGYYDGERSNFSLNFSSDEIDYQTMKFKGINLSQQLTSSEISAEYEVNEFFYTDSIIFHKLRFLASGTQYALNSALTWDQGTDDASKIEWKTFIPDNSEVHFELQPSYFSINRQRWEIEKQSDLAIANNELHIAKLKLQREKQYILLDGCISRNDSDRLNFRANDIDLADISELLGTTVEMEGTLNGWGYISNPYTNLTYMGDASIQQLYLNKQEVGDIYVQSDWNKRRESIGLTGDLTYRSVQTFRFDGNYYLDRDQNNLDFDLIFDKTDLQFTNAFMDPDVVNNIKGMVDGRLKVSGRPEFPVLKGEVNLLAGNAKVELLGVNFGLNGKIRVDEYGFYIDNMPVTDEEGSSAGLVGSIYHTNFRDWNFDLQFDLDRNLSLYSSPFISFVPNGNTMNKFLLLNTKFKEGDYYFGKAYVTGSANIFGYADNIDITVDLKTQRGTTINFPMYGMKELEEDESYILFKKKGEILTEIEPKIDFTGVNLDLNFRVTPDAKMKIIFNETNGDEINANGNGDITIKLDNLGDLTMEGTYRFKEGSYNFAMGPIRQPFYIEDGGSITWTGDPYNATIDLKTYYEVYANLTEIAPDQFQGSTANSTQTVQCYLGLTESLMKPSIGFDIKAPKADESGKALIARITGDKDELNRQFFSLMLWKRFQPLRGTMAAGGSAAMDLVSNQINSMLSQVSKDYKLNVNLDSDQLRGESTYEFGVTKGFLDNRLIVNGSFGVENITKSAQSQSVLIGDVRLEYLLNENGTVRVNVFNESNDYSVIQEKNVGLFTQGAGIHYQEDFDNFGNFKLAQYFLDIFRSKENKRYPVKRKKRQTEITD
jgi:hypothetical protein